jgi:hypothetical protein
MLQVPTTVYFLAEQMELTPFGVGAIKYAVAIVTSNFNNITG